MKGLCQTLTLCSFVVFVSITTSCSKDWISPPGTITEKGLEESRRVGELVKKALFVHDVPNPQYIVTTDEYNRVGYALVKSADSGVNFLKYLGYDPGVDTSRPFDWGAQICGGERITFSGPIERYIVGEIFILVESLDLTIFLVTEKYLENLPPEQMKDLQYFPF